MIPRMNYQQYRTARRLVHSCCNFDGGCCLLLDNGEECVCPQSITYSLICKWFRIAVLALDVGLCAALFPNPSIGQRRCRETIQEKGITQYKLLKDGVLDNRSLSALKHNKNVTLLTLASLCKALDCTLDKIVRLTDE